MLSEHVDKLAISLYAVGYRYLPRKTAFLIGEHIYQCETCGSQLLSALHYRDMEDARAIKAAEVRGISMGVVGSSAKGLLQGLLRRVERVVSIGNLGPKDIDWLVCELAALDDIRDMVFCIRTVFEVSEYLGLEVWSELDRSSLVDKLVGQSDIEIACFCIRQLLSANVGAGLDLLRSTPVQQMACSGTDFGKISDLFAHMSDLLELEELSEGDHLAVLTGGVLDSV